MTEPKFNTGTSCNQCIFAKYNNENNQIDCEAGQLEKFAMQNTELDMATAEGKSFYIIKDRICLMCCPPENVQKLNLKNPLKDMRERIKLKCSAFIIMDDEYNLDQLELTVKSLVNQILPPKDINIILAGEKNKNGAVIFLLKELEKEKVFTWNVTRIFEPGASREWALDHTIAKCESPFYTVFLAGFEAPFDFLSSIDKALNDNLDRFSVLLPTDGYWNGAFVQTILHKKLHGNEPQKLADEIDEDGNVVSSLVATSIMEKIEWVAKDCNQTHMVRKVEEICPSMLV